MKTSRTLLLGADVLAIALVGAAQSTTPPLEQGVSGIKAADFGWMSGRWIGGPLWSPGGLHSPRKITVEGDRGRTGFHN